MSNQVYENQFIKYTDDDFNAINNQLSGSGPLIPFVMNLTGPWIVNQSYIISYRVTTKMVTLFFPPFVSNSDNNSPAISAVIPLPSVLLIPAGNFFYAPMNVINQSNNLNGMIRINMTSGACNFFISPTNINFVGASNVGFVGTEINYYLQ